MLMSGIGFDKGEETSELVTLEMTNSKWKLKFALYVFCESSVLGSSDVCIILKNVTQ